MPNDEYYMLMMAHIAAIEAILHTMIQNGDHPPSMLGDVAKAFDEWSAGATHLLPNDRLRRDHHNYGRQLIGRVFDVDGWSL